MVVSCQQSERMAVREHPPAVERKRAMNCPTTNERQGQSGFGKNQRYECLMAFPRLLQGIENGNMIQSASEVETSSTYFEKSAGVIIFLTMAYMRV